MPNVESVAEAPQSQGRSGAPLTVLFVTVFVDLLGFGIVIPFLPMYAERLEVGAAGIGLNGEKLVAYAQGGVIAPAAADGIQLLTDEEASDDQKRKR